MRLWVRAKERLNDEIIQPLSFLCALPYLGADFLKLIFLGGAAALHGGGEECGCALKAEFCEFGWN